MAIKKYNICVKKVYQKDGEEKAFWPSVGTLSYFPATEGKQGGFKLEIPIFGNTQFYVFEVKPKEDKPKVETGPEVNSDDVPF